MPDKHEVDGSIPFEPTNFLYFYKKMYIENYIEKAKKGKLAYWSEYRDMFILVWQFNQNKQWDNVKHWEIVNNEKEPKS